MTKFSAWSVGDYDITYEDCSSNDACYVKDGEVYLEIYDQKDGFRQIYEEHLK